MSVIPVYYNVTIEAVTGASPSDGFIDPTPLKNYIDNDGTNLETGWAKDLDSALAKTRANYRWLFVVQQCSLLLNPLYIIDILTPGADQDTAPTSVEFTIVYDRPDYLNTVDETDPSVTLSGADAIKRFVARAMCANRETNAVVMDPTQLTGSTTQQVHRGETVEDIVIGPLCNSVTTAEASITVVQVPNT